MVYWVGLLTLLLSWLGWSVPFDYPPNIEVRLYHSVLFQEEHCNDNCYTTSIVGSADHPDWWPHEVTVPTIKISDQLDDGRFSGQMFCTIVHETLHIIYGPDNQAKDIDGWWREEQVYRETNEFLPNLGCPTYVAR